MKKITCALLMTVMTSGMSFAGLEKLRNDNCNYVAAYQKGAPSFEVRKRRLGESALSDFNESKKSNLAVDVTVLSLGLYKQQIKNNAPSPMINSKELGIYTLSADASAQERAYKIAEQNAKKQNQIIASKNGFTRFASTQNYYVGLLQAAVTTIYKQLVSIFWA